MVEGGAGPPALVDSHCHLGDAAFAADREAVLARAGLAGVRHIVVVASTLEDSRQILDLVEGRESLRATAGVHPHDARSWDNVAALALRELLRRPEVVAVGETGLDYHYEHSTRPVQLAAFRDQLAIAAEAHKPVVVHARDADADIARTISEARTDVILHSFSAGAEVFEAGMATGAYFSFSGMITFKNWRLAASVTACPLDRLLVETDSPYLAPVPHRGQRNEPAFVREVAHALAGLRNDTFENVARATTANARRVFGSLAVRGAPA